VRFVGDLWRRLSACRGSCLQALKLAGGSLRHESLGAEFDRVCFGMLSWWRPDRGAEAMSSRAEVPRSFGGPSERCSRIFRRSRRRQSRRGGWGAWLTPAHCHPRNRVERYRGARRLLSSRVMLLFLRAVPSSGLQSITGFCWQRFRTLDCSGARLRAPRDLCGFWNSQRQIETGCPSLESG
jgi:hypothetical protein